VQILVELMVMRVDDPALAARIEATMARDPAAAQVAAALLRDDERVEMPLVMPSLLLLDGAAASMSTTGALTPALRSVTAGEAGRPMWHYERLPPEYDVTLDATARAPDPDRIGLELHLLVDDRALVPVTVDGYDTVDLVDDLRVDHAVEIEVAPGAFERLDVPGLLVYVRATAASDRDALDEIHGAWNAARDEVIGRRKAKTDRARHRLAEELLGP
jgi:hypothetical protein